MNAPPAPLAGIDIDPDAVAAEMFSPLGANPANPLTAEPPHLFRPLPAPDPFPTDALGRALEGAVRAIADMSQAHTATAAGSVLAAASLAVQGLADIELPIAGGDRRPTSLFIVTVAASGERKSTADRLALAPVAEFEEELAEAYRRDLPAALAARDAWTAARDRAKRAKGDWREARDAMQALGPEPSLPMAPFLIATEPTLPGLGKLFREARPSLGLMTGEGAMLLGGWGFQREHRLATMGGLNSLWDGATQTRIRAGDELAAMPGRRLTLHLLTQPTVAARLLADHEAEGIGLLARFLVAQPPELAGTRFQRANRPESGPALDRFQSQLAAILRLPLPTAPGDPRRLQPRRLRLTPDGEDAWRAFADRCEARLGPEGAWHDIKAWGSKAAEHASRLAAVVALFHDPELAAIDATAFERGARLAEFYGAEMRRLAGAAAVDADLLEADKLRQWIVKKGRRLVAASEVLQFGPNALRTADKARKAIERLEAAGVLEPVPGGSDVGGKRRRDVWRVVT